MTSLADQQLPGSPGGAGAPWVGGQLPNGPPAGYWGPGDGSTGRCGAAASRPRCWRTRRCRRRPTGYDPRAGRGGGVARPGRASCPPSGEEEPCASIPQKPTMKRRSNATRPRKKAILARHGLELGHYSSGLRRAQRRCSRWRRRGCARLRSRISSTAPPTTGPGRMAIGNRDV